MEREFNAKIFTNIIVNLVDAKILVKYQGDLADCGNEIGLVIGKYYPNLNEDEITEFIFGIRHGISLTNGTH